MKLAQILLPQMLTEILPQMVTQILPQMVTEIWSMSVLWTT